MLHPSVDLPLPTMPAELKLGKLCVLANLPFFAQAMYHLFDSFSYLAIMIRHICTLQRVH
jgi:hypothetical protein